MSHINMSADIYKIFCNDPSEVVLKNKNEMRRKRKLHFHLLPINYLSL